MSDYDTGDTGADTGADYGHYEAGQEHADLDQLHQAAGSEQDASSQYGVYEQDHAAGRGHVEGGRHGRGHSVRVPHGHDGPERVGNQGRRFTNRHDASRMRAHGVAQVAKIAALVPAAHRAQKSGAGSGNP